MTGVVKRPHEADQQVAAHADDLVLDQPPGSGSGPATSSSLTRPRHLADMPRFPVAAARVTGWPRAVDDAYARRLADRAPASRHAAWPLPAPISISFALRVLTGAGTLAQVRRDAALEQQVVAQAALRQPVQQVLLGVVQVQQFHHAATIAAP